jgi:hypothetical protein
MKTTVDVRKLVTNDKVTLDDGTTYTVVEVPRRDERCQRLLVEYEDGSRGIREWEFRANVTYTVDVERAASPPDPWIPSDTSKK